MLLFLSYMLDYNVTIFTEQLVVQANLAAGAQIGSNPLLLTIPFYPIFLLLSIRRDLTLFGSSFVLIGHFTQIKLIWDS